jgi:hypothetical protein
LTEPGKCLSAFFTHPLECEHFRNVKIDGLTGGPAHPGRETVVLSLKQRGGISICNSQVTEGTGVFLRHSNVQNAGLLVNNDLSRALKVFERENRYRLPRHAAVVNGSQ